MNGMIPSRVSFISTLHQITIKFVLVYSSLFIFSAKLLELLSSRLCTFVEKYLTLHTAYQNAVSMILDLKDELPLKETESK